MSKPTEYLEKNLKYCFRGNKDALKFCMDLWEIAQVWDDLIDNDNPELNADMINKAFMKALVEIPDNIFYYQNIGSLKTLVMNTILQWFDANVLEKGDDNDKHKAYMLRAGIYEIFCFCAYIIGGPDWYKEIGPDMRRLYGETLESFMKED